MFPRLQTRFSVLPPVPSATPVYKGSNTTTVNETTSTFTGVDIGVAHPRRIVILAAYLGVAATSSATINGVPCVRMQHSANHEAAIFYARAPDGVTASIEITAVGSLRKAFGTYVAYPRSDIPLMWSAASATGTTDASSGKVRSQAGGFIVYVGDQNIVLGTFITTYSPETVTEDVDAQLEGISSYTWGQISSVSISSDPAKNVNLAASTSGTKRIVGASWGPA